MVDVVNTGVRFACALSVYRPLVEESDTATGTNV